MKPDYELTTAVLNDGIRRCVENIASLLDSAMTLASTKSNYALGLYLYAVEEFGKALLMKQEYIKKNQTHKIPQKWFIGREAHKEKLKTAFQNLPESCKKVHAKIITVPYGPYKINVDKNKRLWQHEQTKVKLLEDVNGGLIEGNMIVELPIDLRMRENMFHTSYDIVARRFKNGISPRSDELKQSIQEMQKVVSDYNWSL
jgi:AbiV family abortive infection protein